MVPALVKDLIGLYDRDIQKLYTEVEAYATEAGLWAAVPGIANPGGNLCLHLVGNLNTYIGHEIGGIAYVRNRPLEFSRKDVPREELLAQVSHTRNVVAESLAQLSPEMWEQEYPQRVFDGPMSHGWFLMHLSTHLNYHLGQLNYHRRMVDATVS